MKLYCKRYYKEHEIVTLHSWITYYPKFKNFDLEIPGKAVVIHLPIPIWKRAYDIDSDEIKSGWRFPVLILSWYTNRILLCYGNIFIYKWRGSKNVNHTSKKNS